MLITVLIKPEPSIFKQHVIYTHMNNFINFVILLLLMLLASCQDQVGNISIQRNGSLSFEVNGEKWSASTYTLNQGPLVIKYVDNPDAGTLFNQYAIIAEGTTPAGMRFQLSILFATKNVDDFVGTYTTAYTSEGGLDQIYLNQETGNNTNLYTHYQFCLPKDSLSTFVVARQSTDEKLVLGSFEGNLCHIGRDGKAVSITDGDFEDIKYEQN